MVGVQQYVLRNHARRFDPLESTYRPGPSGRPVHAGRVQLDHALFVGQAPVSHRGVLCIEFLRLDTLNGGVERIHALDQQSAGQLHTPQTVGRRDGHRARGGADMHGGETRSLSEWRAQGRSGGHTSCCAEKLAARE